jgi:hypothetical protein
MPLKHVRAFPGGACAVLALSTALSLLSVGALSAQLFVPTVSCPLAGTATASPDNGFYVTAYPGNRLSQVTLGYTATAAQRFGISLTAHRNTYDGPIIGSTQTANADVPTSGEILVTFDFGSAPVTPGDRIAFTQTFVNYGPRGAWLYYDGGNGPCGGVFQTLGTAPPLGGPIQGSAGVTITQTTPQFGENCVPSDTALCLDYRFQVTASYHTALAGGLSGNAQAIPLLPLGVTHGGLFWFFSPDNPEVVVKVLDGCAINDHYWVYVSAGTNVGFSVTVTDTHFKASKTYTNPDLKEALPVQDTSALASCHECTSDAQCPTGLLCCFLPVDHHACLAPGPGGTTCVPIP